VPNRRFSRSRKRETPAWQQTANIERFAGDWVIVHDVSPVFLGRNDEFHPISENGRLTYQDGEHLSDAGAAMVRPLLAKAIESALANCSGRC
jgi:hypothetical protein